MAKQLIPKNQNLIIERFEYRIIYCKTGRARYISHLDLMRTMQRVFKRAGIPLWYTQGFNPHAYLMFPLALPLGTDSCTEILDVALVEKLEYGEIKDRLNAAMPEGLKVRSVAEPIMKHTEIASAEYVIRFTCNYGADRAKELFYDFLGQDRIEIEKRSKKKGINLVDIKPHIRLVSAAAENGETLIDLILPAGNSFNLNTAAVIDAFCRSKSVEINSIYTERTKIMTESGELFI
ncbi:TIGR03936 family radical SAM-associated protein [Ruminococcus sp. Marseille-P6503]|uniref:TIGR03936 family radical SAM-associated protein n=1 Tax=Ruminococcus sp. Marseille-P6503 TaxID=2364796 RepID=UPI0013DDB2C7|nr:TIGR03936 family radical SAM-associated protein [Ruminococcus sp. Marseille-P6503]